MAAARPAGCRHRLPDQAGRPAHPDALRQELPAGQPDLLRPPGDRRRLRLQAVPARGARRDPGRVRRRLPLGRAAHQAPGRGRTVVEVGVPALSRGRPARRPAREPRSSSGPSATSGCSGCACGRRPERALSRGEPILGDAHRATAERRRSDDGPRRPGGYSGRGPSRVPASPPRSSELTKSRKTSSRGSAGDAASPVDSRSSIEPCSPSSGRTPARSRTSSAA